MKNLEQIRAKNALKASIGGGAEGGETVAKKVPTMIRDNGILGAAAFALETGKGYEDTFDAIIAHLADKDIRKLEKKIPLREFIAWLAGLSSTELRAVNAEIMAYLNYVRRFC